LLLFLLLLTLLVDVVNLIESMGCVAPTRPMNSSKLTTTATVTSTSPAWQTGSNDWSEIRTNHEKKGTKELLLT
jgi:hypothetical protein